MFKLSLKVLGQVVPMRRRHEMYKLDRNVNIATFHPKSISQP